MTPIQKKEMASRSFVFRPARRIDIDAAATTYYVAAHVCSFLEFCVHNKPKRTVFMAQVANYCSAVLSF